MESLVFRLCEKAPDILREVCLERGWEEYSENGGEADGGWNLWWKTQGFTSGEFEHCRPWQRLNHFPKSTNITKKDGLARNLRRMRTSYGGSMFEFFPLTFILPNEYKKFVAEFSKQDGRQQSNYWICKPTEQSCGRGIFIFQDLHDLTYDCAVVVQKYIIKPYLISGYKFDLRLYAIVTSFHPFRLYIYHEGLVRFSTERFDLSSLDNRFSHLTNTSINKTGPQYMAEKESIGIGCKWTLTKLRHYFHKHSIDDRFLWHRITSIIIITLLSQVQEIPSNSSNCFELFGFDILLDEKLKPWLLEVNFSPALGNDCSQDELVKRPLLNDILEALNFSEADIKRGRKEKENNITRKKRDAANTTFQNGKSISSKLASKQTPVPKSNFTIFPLQTESECQQVTKGVNPALDERKLGTKKASKRLEENSCASGSNGKKSMPRCKAPCPKYNLLNHKRLSTSEEFLKAAEIRCNGQEELNDSKVPLNYTKEDDLAFRNNSDAIFGAEDNQPFSLEGTKEDENGYNTDDNEENEQMSNPRQIARSQSQSGSSMHLSPLENKCSRLPSHLRLRRYKSEASSLNSLHSIHKHGLSNGSTGTLNHISSRYSTRISTTSRHAKQSYDSLKLPPQIGNCILAFPFNEVTHKASNGELNQKVVVEEIRKTLKAINSHIKSSPSDTTEDETNSLDLSKPFWGYRSKLNTFYSSL